MGRAQGSRPVFLRDGPRQQRGIICGISNTGVEGHLLVRITKVNCLDFTGVFTQLVLCKVNMHNDLLFLQILLIVSVWNIGVMLYTFPQLLFQSFEEVLQ
jgi:hypothetical protein